MTETGPEGSGGCLDAFQRRAAGVCESWKSVGAVNGPAGRGRWGGGRRSMEALPRVCGGRCRSRAGPGSPSFLSLRHQTCLEWPCDDPLLRGSPGVCAATTFGSRTLQCLLRGGRKLLRAFARTAARPPAAQKLRSAHELLNCGLCGPRAAGVFRWMLRSYFASLLSPSSELSESSR